MNLEFLAEWQALVGAALGTFGAFLVAVFAFGAARFSERQDAAFTVYFELRMYQTAVSAFLDDVLGPSSGARMTLGDDDVFKYVKAVEQLRSARPAVTPRLDQAMAKLYATDFVLAAHLEGFRAAAQTAERVFTILEETERRQFEGRDPGFDKDHLLDLIRSAGGLARGAASQGDKANQILGTTYLNRGAWLRRFQRRLRRHKLPGEYLAEVREQRIHRPIGEP